MLQTILEQKKVSVLLLDFCFAFFSIYFVRVISNRASISNSTLVIQNDITWTGLRWVAISSGPESNPIAYSSDGKTWVKSFTIVFNKGYGIAWNAGVGSVNIKDTSIVLDKYGPGLSNTLSIVGPPYHQIGFNNLAVSII